MVTCPSCRTESDDGARICKECGSALPAAGAGEGASAAGESTALTGEPAPTAEAGSGIPIGRRPDFGTSSRAAAEEDKVGAGRYVLSFFLAGFIGLGVQYVLRTKGWTATYINAAIFVLLIVVLVATA